MNPWQPPAGWDRIEPAATEGPWTIRAAFRAMGRAFRKQPLGVLLALFVIPGLWMVPMTIAHSRFVPEDEPVFGPGRSLVSVAVSLGSTAWNSVWYAGALRAAIEAVRGEPIRWRGFITGLSLAPVLFLSSVALTLPFELVGMLPLDVPRGEVFSLFDAILFPLTMYLAARTCIWAPLLVDARRSLKEGLMESWVMTWGSTVKILVFGGILFTGMMLILIVNYVFADEAHVAYAVNSGVYLLAEAVLYTLIHGAPAPQAPGVSPSPSPGP